MKNPAPDKRVDKTFDKLEYALFQLIQEKEPDRISVTSLCDAAGICRSTFYDYFSSVQDLLDYFTNRHLRAMRLGIDKYLVQGTDYLGYYQWLLTYMKENKEAVQCLYAFDFRTHFVSKTDVFWAENSKGTIQQREFCQYGCTALIRSWLDSECAEPVEELAATLTHFIELVHGCNA